MSFILSIFLCFALAFGGAGSLPAEPETATTWTIRNLAVTDGTDSYTFDPQLRITAAAGAEKVNLHFELESQDQTLLPVTAEVTPEELRFAMANGGRAYSLSAEDLESIMDLDPESAQIMEIISDLFLNYGALLGTMSSDEEQSRAYNEAVMNAVIETCGVETEAVEIELADQTLDAQKLELNITLDSSFQLLDALRGCGVEPLEGMLEDMLKLMRLTHETEYADFAAVKAALIEDLGEDEELNFSLPMTITAAEAEDISYALVECSVNVEDEAALELREEVATIGDETGITMTMTMEADGTEADYAVSGTLTGPLTDPTSVHIDYDIAMTNTLYLNTHDEISPIREDGESSELSSETNVRMTIDFANADGLRDLRCNVSFDTDVDGDEDSGEFALTAVERAEMDGSVTADVEILISADGETIGASFELNRAEGAVVDYFDGLEMYEISDETMNGSNEEPSLTMTALVADVSLMNMDAMQLTTDPSIQALMDFGEVDPDIVYDDEEIEPDEDEDYSYDESEYEVRAVDTLEEAAAIYQGDIPAYTAPEGYELREVDVSSTYLSAIYMSENDYLNLTLYGYDRNSHFFAMDDGALTAMDGYVAQLYGDDLESITSATVYPQDGSASINFYFGNYLTPDEVSVILAGLE